jgi:lysozyme
MHISQRGIDLIKSFEGVKLTAYLCPANVLTIGYGHTGRDVTEGLIISEARAEELLRSDLMRFEDAVAKHAGPCPQGQFDALVSFAFNLGIAAMAGSTLVRRHKAGDFAAAAAEFPRWNKGGGRVLPGLARRRAAERALYLS